MIRAFAWFHSLRKLRQLRCSSAGFFAPGWRRQFPGHQFRPTKGVYFTRSSKNAVTTA